MKITVIFDVLTKGNPTNKTVENFLEVIFMGKQSTSDNDGTIVFDREKTNLEFRINNDK